MSDICYKTYISQSGSDGSKISSIETNQVFVYQGISQHASVISDV